MNVAELYKNKNGISWYERNTEISINNVYFEVLSVTLDGDKAIITVAKDEKENNLIANFFSSQKKNNEILFHLVKLFFNINLDANPVTSPSNRFAIISIDNRQSSNDRFDPGYFIETIKPPQQQA